jgi:death-on-curing protein
VTVWLSHQLILAIHDEQLAEHGGALGTRDDGLLASALARPLHRPGYGDPDIAELASLYAIAIARNRPFVDGNKRTAYVALKIFILLNGCGFPVGEVDAVVHMLQIAAGDIGDDAFIAWVRSVMTSPTRSSHVPPPPSCSTWTGCCSIPRRYISPPSCAPRTKPATGSTKPCSAIRSATLGR